HALLDERFGPRLIRRFAFRRAASDVAENVAAEAAAASSTPASGRSVAAAVPAAGLPSGLAGSWRRAQRVDTRRGTVGARSGLPHAGQIRLAIRRSRRRCLQIDLAVRQFGGVG